MFCCCVVMLPDVHAWSTYLLSILLRNHMWELHWSAAANNNDDDGQQHTFNLYIYLKISHFAYWCLYNISHMLNEHLKYHTQWFSAGIISHLFFVTWILSHSACMAREISHIHSSWFSCLTFWKLVFGNTFRINLISLIHV